MSKSHPSKGLIALPIDFLDVGLLKARTFKPMGMLTLDSISNLSYAEFIHKVKTASFRQLKELQAKSSDDFRVCVRHLTMESDNDKAKFTGYVGRLTTATAKSLESFLETTLKYNLSLQVEIWLKSDMNNPSEYYRNIVKTSERDAATTTLTVEATELGDAKVVNPSTEPAGKFRLLFPQLLTAHCVRAFRKDLENRLLFCSGIYQGPICTTLYKVDIYFKRKGSSHQSMVAAATEKSKDTFEECVFSCLEKKKPMKLQYRIKPINPPTKTVPPVKDVRGSDVFFGSKTSFGNQPASTSPPQVSVPTTGSPFSQYVRSAPLRMSDAGSATSFKTFHDGFYEAVKQASQSKTSLVVPVQQATPTPTAQAPASTKTIDNIVEAMHKSMDSTSEISSKQATAEEEKAKEAKGKESSRVGGNSLALKQVESLLTKFMVNLNQTLLDNFGNDASTLSILHDSDVQAVKKVQAAKELQAPKEEKVKKEASPSDAKPKCSRFSGQKYHSHHSGPTKGVRHDAYCNLCNHVIVGNRHKCVNCPDWDCCDKCRVTANEAHPGHSFMKIDSLDILTQSVHPSDWVLHPNIYCDGCDAKVLGPRFKCIECDDFDWCVDCEADPSKKHNLGDYHIFLKINKPVLQSSRIDHCVMQGKEIIGEMQQIRAIRATLPEQQVKQQIKEQEMQQQWNKLGIYGSKTPEEKEAKTPSIDNLADSENKEKPANVSVLVPDLFYPAEAKKEDSSDKTPVEGDSVLKDLSVVHKRLSFLFNDAQKLPGAQSLAAESPIKAQAETTSPLASSQDDKEDFDMEVVSDVNMPDGTKVFAGTQFEKLWTVKNSGRKAWPSSTQLRLTLSSNNVNSDRVVAPFQTAVLPQQIVKIGVNDLDAGEQLGNHHFYFRLELPIMGNNQGKRFGQQLWCQVEVIDGSPSNSDSFISARGGKVDQWEHQGSSLGSSIFHLPNAPESLATTSETGTNAPTPAEPLTEAEEVDTMSLTSSEDYDEDFEIIEPSSEGEDDDESYL